MDGAALAVAPRTTLACWPASPRASLIPLNGGSFRVPVATRGLASRPPKTARDMQNTRRDTRAGKRSPSVAALGRRAHNGPHRRSARSAPAKSARRATYGGRTRANHVIRATQLFRAGAGLPSVPPPVRPREAVTGRHAILERPTTRRPSARPTCIRGASGRRCRNVEHGPRSATTTPIPVSSPGNSSYSSEACASRSHVAPGAVARIGSLVGFDEKSRRALTGYAIDARRIYV